MPSLHAYELVVQVAFMFNEWYKPRAVLEFPKGGSQAIVDALARGTAKHGGRVHTRSHVEEIVLEGGRAAGVRLRGGAQVRDNASGLAVSCIFINCLAAWSRAGELWSCGCAAVRKCDAM